MEETIQADLLIRDVQVYNSYFKTFDHADVFVVDGKFYYIDRDRTQPWEATKTVEGRGRYMIPGLVDIHMHIESSMMTPAAFCERLVQCGVTTIVSEPHEMANVNGMNGVLDMIRAGSGCPVDIFYGIPSCVPSTSSALETTGGSITCQDMEQLKNHSSIVCVGEVMSYRQVIRKNNLEITKFLSHLRKTDKIFPIEGHCPALLDFDLAKFLYLGINGDHTEHSIEELRQRFANGMFVEIQEKMLQKEVVDFITENNLFEYFCFVTDDVMADNFCQQGHLDALIRHAIKLGMSVEQAVYQATFTPSRRMNLLDRGAIDPGKLADFVLLDDLRTFLISEVYKNGDCIYDKNESKCTRNRGIDFAESYYHSIKLEPKSMEHFNIPTEKDGSVLVRVMEVQDGSTKTVEKAVEMQARNGRLCWEETGVMLAVVFERYGLNGGTGYGFITGDCHKHGAVATSYAHDCHNVLVAGENPKDMMIAVNRVIEMQGGMAVSLDGSIQADLKLNIGGIMSESPAEEIGEALGQVRKAMELQGYSHYNPIMSFCTITLPVSPALKLTDKGLIDVGSASIVSMFRTR